jgi:hypothetical protein
VINQMGVTLAVFWAFWSFRSVAWSFPAFALALAGPGLVYAAACALVPEDPSAVLSWRVYYYSVRRKFFTCVVGWAVVAGLGTTFLLDMPWSHPARATQMFALVFGMVGIAFERERVHSSLAAIYLVVLIVGTITVLAQPGSLAP